MSILKTTLPLLFFLAAFGLNGQSTTECPEATIEVVGNNTPDLLCQGDGIPNTLRFRTSNSAAPYSFVVTDDAGTILQLGFSNLINFENLPVGALRVYAFSFLGQITAEVGDNLFSTELASLCYQITSNFISLTNETPDGGIVSTIDGEQNVVLCVGDEIADVLNFTTTSASSQYIYVITDENNVILDFSVDGTVDFELAGVGVCRVWGLSYIGDLLAEIGANAATAQLASECFDLSNNYVEVVRLFPDAGTLSYADGSTDFLSCSVLEPTDVLSLTSMNSNPDADFTYVLVDATTGLIVQYITGTEVVLADIPTGAFQIYGISYTGNLTAGPGDPFAGGPLSDECDDRSDNFVTLTKRVQNADDVILEDGTSSITICVGDGIPDPLTFISSYTGGDSFAYLITDESNFLLGISDDATIDFEGAGAGICRVWGVAYSGDLTIQEGENIGSTIPLSNECWDLSDGFVLINRNGPEGGTISFADGSIDFLSCSVLEPTDVLSLASLNSDPDADFTYVLVDATTGLIVQYITGTEVVLADIPTGAFQIYGLSYTGNLTADPGDPFAGDPLSDQCYDRSDNFVTLTKRVQNADDIILEDGTSSITICVGDGIPDPLTFISSYTGGDSFAYLITDESNFLLGVSADATIDFEGAGAGICRVWGVAYSGDLTIQEGENIGSTIPLSNECWDLSDGFVVINRNGPEGGTISFADGETSFLNCTDDTPSGTVDLFVENNDDSVPFGYVVVDIETGLVASVLTGSSTLDLANLPLGSYEVYGVSYIGSIALGVGDLFDADAVVEECFDLSDNTLTIANRIVNAGAVAFEDGSTTAYICPGDGVADILNYQTDYSGADDFAFVITDADNVILQIAIATSLDFDVPGPEIIRIYGVASSGSFLLQAGNVLDETTLISSECYDISDNFLTVDRTGPNAGSVALADNSTAIAICVGDGIPDVLNFTSDGDQENFIWVITDDNNVILDTNETGEIDFEGAGAGVCRVWGLSYIGELLAQAGDNAAEVQLADECFDLSDNFVTVNRTFVDGGSVSLLDGSTMTFACTGDGEPDFYEFEFTSTSAEEYRFVITDDNNLILGILESNSINLDEAAPGTCRVWGLSYTGEITAGIGDDAAAIDLTDGCFELSENFVTIRREEVIGGEVAFPDGSTIINICPNDGNTDVLSFTTTGTSTASYRYILTDVNNNILGSIDGNSLDFDNLSAPTEVRVWGVAHSGVLTAPTGEDAADVALSSECYELSSNFLRIIRETPDGGNISTASGLTELTLCNTDGIPDIIDFANLGASNTDYAYLVTSVDNVVLMVVPEGESFDFEALPTMNLRVWGVAYTGNLTVAPLDDAAVVPLSDDCFDLSENFIPVTMGTLQAGTVALPNGDDTVFTCPGDGEDDVIAVDSLGVGDPLNYNYVLTDENNIILGILSGDTYNFETEAAGTYRIWGLNFTGDLLAMIGDDAAAVSLATGCADLSDNFITVVNVEPVAGVITTADGEGSVELCIGDGVADPVTLEVTGASDANYAFLVIDEDGFLVGVLEDATFDFENAAPGDWQIYGLSYTGSISLLPGGNIFEDQLASGCSALTEQPFFVNKTQVDGGTVFAGTGDQVLYVCPDDGEADIFSFVNSSAASEASYQYILTTEDNFVLNIIDGNTVDFELTAGFDHLRVWGISYTGNLLLTLGQNAAEVALSDGCYTLSDNAVDIFRDQPEGGTLSYADGSTEMRLCHSNFMPGVQVNTTSGSLAGYVYLVTDTANVVIDVVESNGGFIDFTPYEEGLYRIWGLSYTGEILVELGDNAAEVTLASSCHELSANFLTLERTGSLDGGDISTLVGEDVIYTCPGDGLADLVILSTTSADLSYKYIVTDTFNRVLQGDVEGNVINFDLAEPGVCRVYGVSFTGELNPMFMDDVLVDPLSTDCWALSNNYITVVRQTPEGGQVTTGDGETDVIVTVDDGEADVLNIVSTGAAPFTPYAFVITDEENVILGISVDGVIDFEEAGAGVCRVWGLSYTGNVNAQIGDDADEIVITDDCYDLSDNFVTVTRVSNFGDGSNFTNSEIDFGTEDQLGDVQVNVWPNPVQTILNISLQVPEGMDGSAQLLEVYNINGIPMLSQMLEMASGQMSLELDVSNLQDGMYWLRWNNGQEAIMTRFIKQ